jgi:rRNA maturation endonuclease Nob1
MSGPMMQRKAWDPAQDKRGLECRCCGCKQFRVIYTRAALGSRIMPRRECRHCGGRVATWERAGP